LHGGPLALCSSFLLDGFYEVVCKFQQVALNKQIIASICDF